MGSEKRKKEKKEKKSKRSRKHERSDSEERKDVDRKEKKDRKKKTKLDDSPGDNNKSSMSIEETNKMREKLGMKPLDVEPPAPKDEDGANVVSLSIEETNDLRAKLGLRPLDVGTSSGTASERSEVHAPPKNMGKILETEKLAERMKMMQEKRRIKEQLSRVKSLGSTSTDLTDTFAWVNRSRSIDAKKAAAEKQTKMLDSLEEDFGIDELMEQEKKQYTSKDLKDLTVLHDVSQFQEGNMTILTLQDRGILDEDGEEDVLVNVNMLDNEKVDRNNELKKKKPDYNPYTDEVDEFGNVKRQNMLSKYDEVIEGEKKKSFKLSEAENTEVIRKKMAKGLAVKPGNVNLDSSHLKKVAAEYFTTDEVAAFKKPRKKKLRKIRKTRVEEIMPLPNEEPVSGSKDHGSRAKFGGKQKRSGVEPQKPSTTADDDNMEIDIDEPETKVNGNRGQISEKELYSVKLEDEDTELEAALARSRRKKLLQDSKSFVSTIANMATKEESIPGVSKTSEIVLDRTAEFAKGIGAGAHEKEEVKEEEVMEVKEEEKKTTSDWKDIDFVTATFGEFQDYDPNAGQQEVIEAEPSLQRGLSGALQVAQRKGFIEVDKNSLNSKDISDAIQATGSLRARFFQVDRDTGQDVDSRRRGDREYGSGQFPEKRNYNPDVKIVYTDNIGRELNSKEAFRQLSHKFHGKGSGKMKTEKRMKKAVEEMSLKKMESDDTPLGSAALLREKQKEANSSYIILSGGNRIPSEVNNSIAKLSKK